MCLLLDPLTPPLPHSLPPAPPATANWQSYRPLTLEAMIRANDRLPVPECVRIAATLADGLPYRHDQGLVHRDSKHSNIVFVDGVPKLAELAANVL